MPFTQESRFIAIDTPLGKDALLLLGFQGMEGLSVPFSFELELLSENHKIVFKDIIGKNVTISVMLANGEKRFFNGIISRLSQGQGDSEEDVGLRFSYYTATMVPWLWLLTRTAGSRIFQKLSVPEIVEKIFTEKGFLDYKLRLHGNYDKRDYCVQYRETDFNFICRLLEEEGIYYFFEHEEKNHTMVLADTADEHKPCEKQQSARYQISAGGSQEEDMISSLEVMQEIKAGKYTLNDFNFKTPNTDLKVEAPSQQTLGPGVREIYDHPGGYDKRDGGDRLANIRMQVEEAEITTITGLSNCRAFTSGYKFTLKDYYWEDMNDKAYVLTSVDHSASQEYSSNEAGSELEYSNNFACIAFDVPYRPPRSTPKPVIEGVQTAIVVGPSGEEIHTDEHGRVKVQFHWDREGKKDENSSCWIRVSQAWAGAGWGAMHIPHAGHEVIVDFIEGDPDMPIITGRVYHGANKPPDSLPGEKNKSVIRSFGDNDIVVEDKDGDKHIHIKQACGNEIRMHENTPDIEIKQECGNEVLMKASGPDIEIKQECGNEVLMKASGPDIEIKQACGNEILMHEADGIQMRDKYGNEVVLDAAAGFMRLHSPSHESTIELGKSWVGKTLSHVEWAVAKDEIKRVKGKTLWECGGNLTKLTAGVTSEEFIGAKHTTNLAIFTELSAAMKIEKNLLDRVIKTKKLSIDASNSIKIVAGKGDVSEIHMDSSHAYIECGKSSIFIHKDGDIFINSNGDLTLTTEGEANINAKNFNVSADVSHFEKGELKHKNLQVKT